MELKLNILQTASLPCITEAHPNKFTNPILYDLILLRASKCKIIAQATSISHFTELVFQFCVIIQYLPSKQVHSESSAGAKRQQQQQHTEWEIHGMNYLKVCCIGFSHRRHLQDNQYFFFFFKKRSPLNCFIFIILFYINL